MISDCVNTPRSYGGKIRQDMKVLNCQINEGNMVQYKKTMLMSSDRYSYYRGCSHIMSAKNRGSYTPPPPAVSNGQHFADPPSPLRQQWSAFSLPPLPPSSAFVSIFSPALLYYNFRHRLFDMIKWGIFIC